MGLNEYFASLFRVQHLPRPPHSFDLLTGQGMVWQAAPSKSPPHSQAPVVSSHDPPLLHLKPLRCARPVRGLGSWNQDREAGQSMYLAERSPGDQRR